MPIYVYEPNIQNESREQGNSCCYFESLESIHDAPQKFCPTCGAEVHRVLTGFAIGGAQSTGKSSSSLFQPSSETGASRAAKMAMKHVCGLGCKH